MIKGVPYDAELEYLESTGTQWIDTGVILSSSTDEVEATFYVTQTPQTSIIFGGRASVDSQNYSCGLSTTGALLVDVSNGNYATYRATTTTSSSIPLGMYTIHASRQSRTIAGVVSAANTTLSDVFVTPSNCYLFFGSGDFWTTNKFVGRFYSFRIKRNGVLIRDFIPVRVGTTGYMYDRVSRKLFGNAGTGSFTRGPDKSYPVMSIHRYPSSSGGTALGKMGVGQKMMTSFVVPTSIDQLAALVRSFGSNREAARALLCPQDSMVEIPDTWTAENGTVYSNPQQVVDVDFMENEAGETLLYAICIPKYASAVSIAFDQRNQEPSVEATAQENIHYYGWAAPHDSTKAYVSGEYCTYEGALYKASAAIAANTAWDSSKWASQGSVSIDGTIPVYSSEAVYSANSIVRYTSTALGFTGIFKNSAAITTAGAFDPSQWTLQTFDIPEATFAVLSISTGDSIPYSGYAAVFRTDKVRTSGGATVVQSVLRYGSNNWEYSAKRQYWNNESDTPRGWFHQTHPGQIAPLSNIGQVANAVNSANYGYRHGCSAELLRNVHAVKVPTWPNYITDGPNNTSTVYHTLDTFWDPSGRQWVGNVNANEGEVFPGLLWQYIRALRAAGRKIVPYDATAEGEVGTVYVNTSNGQFYTYRPDITSGTKYSNFTNDDGSWFRDYRTRTIVECETNEERGKNTTTEVYFVTSTQKMYRCTNASGSGTYTEMSHEWYTYNAIGKPTSGVSPLNGARRSFAITNHSSAAVVRLRSANRGNSNGAWNCNTIGYFNYYNANNGYAGRPACAIR